MTTINELIKLADSDSRLLGAIQELAQYRDNPLANMQPCAKYVQENDMNQQYKHLVSECSEFEEAYNLDDRVLEWWDIGQSWLTGMEILKVKYGVDVKSVVAKGQKKNAIRGYDERK